MIEIASPNSKAQRLLKVIVEGIDRRKVLKQIAESFITYSGALARLGIDKWVHAGRTLGTAGLGDLSAWTEQHPTLPKVDGLIVAEQSRRPGLGFLKAHGLKEWDAKSEAWWKEETVKAIDFDWAPYLAVALAVAGWSPTTRTPREW